MIHPLFAIPLYINTVESLDYENINERLLKLDWEKVPQAEGTTTVNKEILNLPEFEDVKISIQEEIEKYVFGDLGVDDECTSLHCNRSWSMLHKTLDFSHSHNHENCQFSGILYTKMPEHGGGLTFFKEPLRYNWILPSIKPKLKEHTELTGNEISFNPEVGTIMIFPSFVYHGTPQNFSNEQRLNIVFNYSIKGEMGDNYFDKQVIK